MSVELATLVNQILVAIVSLVGTLSALWLRNHLQERRKLRHDNLSEMRTQLDEANQIQSMLQQLRSDIDCDRLNIYQFHNGERFVGTGDSFKRLSNTYEVCAPGISSEVHVVQSLPVSLYSIVVQFLANNSYLFAKQITDCIPLQGHVNMLQQRGVVSIYKVPINNIQGNMIAYLSAEWVREEHDFIKNDLVKLLRASALISGYLHTSYKK
jgi:hypothetical protein